MDLQVISRDGEPEYAVLPWAQYQALLRAAGIADSESAQPAKTQTQPSNDELPEFDQVGALRQAKGLELANLARSVGVSPSYLELIENGTREPGAAIKRALAWHLGVAGWRGES